MSWPLVALGEIFEIARGGSPRPIRDFITDNQNGVNWVMISDASESSKYISSTAKRIRIEGVTKSRMVHSGDFLLTNSMSFGRPYIMRTSGCIHDGWLVLSPKNGDVSQDYFYHLLGSNTVYSEFCRLAGGTTVKNLNIDLVKVVKVPLPPFPEQRRIGAILDKAAAIRRKQQRVMERMEDFLRSVFLNMFGDPVTNPKGWDSGTIDDVVANPREDIRCGPFGTQLEVHEIVAAGIPLLGIENVHNDKFVPATKKFLTEQKAQDLFRFDACPGDVLITRMGTIGRACVVPDSTSQARISYHLFRIRPNPKKCLPEFLAATICRSGTFQGQLRRLAHGAIMDGLSTEILKEVKFLLPPVEIQRNYLGAVRKVESLLTKSERGVQRADTLLDSFSYLAFRGELSSRAAKEILQQAATG